MRKVWAIALNTFKEAVRDRILYTILAFAFAMIGGSAILATLSVGGEVRIIKNLGLACITLFGTLIAIFVGIGLVSKEIDKRTIYTVIAKPIHRYQFILGKYVGLVITIFVNVSVMALGLLLLNLAWEGSWAFELLLAALLIFLELMVLTAVTVLFSSFTTPTLSAIFTLSIFVIGHLSADLRLFAERFGGPSLKVMTNVLYYLLPNLEHFNIKGQVAQKIPVSPTFVISALGYGAFYLSALLLSAVLIFQHRDFK